MRLADFIEQRMPDILAAWESFAATLTPASDSMDSAALRDHAEQMLQAMALDLRTAQSDDQQAAKSRGEFAENHVLPRTAAEVHAVLRAASGFSVQQLVSEYRALRASVLKLYARSVDPGPDTIEDIGRFNEAVDQAVAESVHFYSTEVERWRNVFQSILGHDLRGPLNAIVLTSAAIARLTTEKPVSEATARLTASVRRMQELIDDLVDYNRSSLNIGLAVKQTPGDLATCCTEEVELRRASLPNHVIELTINGSTQGLWDASRIKQALGNLIANAASYGAPTGPIRVEVRGEEEEVHLAVRNQGPTLPPEALPVIFEPLRRMHAENADKAHLGLGLFIVREVARAHGGTVTVTSEDGVTEFTLHLPKASSAA